MVTMTIREFWNFGDFRGEVKDEIEAPTSHASVKEAMRHVSRFDPLWKGKAEAVFERGLTVQVISFA